MARSTPAAWTHPLIYGGVRAGAAAGSAGRSAYTVAIGCTGGQHRSVALAEAVGEGLKKLNPAVTVRHRDLAHANRGAAEAATTASS